MEWVCFICVKEMDEDLAEDDIRGLIKAETDGILFQIFAQTKIGTSYRCQHWHVPRCSELL